MSKAPCVAVVGPPNSGKTTLLHWLDARLQAHPDAPLVYVVPGNPDGVGRYLFHSPWLRRDLKPGVKGVWCETTVPTLSGWIDAARGRLDLVLLDLGGRHDPRNEELYERCTHAVVLARPFADPEQEDSEGLTSWVCATSAHGLATVARLRSLGEDGPASVHCTDDGVLEGIFRGKRDAPGDPTNLPVVDALVEALLALRLRRAQPAYVDLNLRRRWTTADLAELGGRRHRIQQDALRGGPASLGGSNTPIYAYARALHTALDVNAHARIEVFDPKSPVGWVQVPEAPRVVGGALEGLRVSWSPRAGGASLVFEILSADKLLPPAACIDPGGLPPLPAPLPDGLLVTDGRGPIWMHLAYSRWLRALAPEASLAVWDGGLDAAIVVHGREAGKRVAWRSAAVTAGEAE